MKDNKVVNKGGRILELDLLRGAAIILMITGHSILVHPIDFTGIPWCHNLHNWIYSFHMELFFLVSGCVYHCSKYRPYILNKMDRLVVPMVFMGIISIFFHSVGSDVVHKHTTMTDGLIGILNGKSYWFLYTLFLIFAIYPLIEKIGTKNKWIEPSLMILLITISQFVNYPTVFRISSMMYHLPYFMMGHLLSDGIKSNRYKLSFRGQMLAVVVALGIYFALLLGDRAISVVRYGQAFAMIAAFYYAAQMFVCWYNSGRKIATMINELLCLASKYSLQLYLFNGFVLVVVRTILVSKLHLTNPTFVIPLIVLANLVVTLSLCKYILEETRWIGWLCGVKYRPWKK